jgi:hypothetical protein
MNMDTLTLGQENRYLESPHTIRDTGADEQSPFETRHDIVGGFVFSKGAFSTTPPTENNQDSKEEGKEIDQANAEGFLVQIPN